MTNTFLTGTCCHLVAKLCYRHKRYLKHQLLLKDDYHRHQCLYLNYKLSSQYFCHNMNDCKTEIILCSWKEAAKHGNCLLSVSAAARTQMWMFWYDFFKGVNRQANCYHLEMTSCGCLNLLLTINRAALYWGRVNFHIWVNYSFKSTWNSISILHLYCSRNS